MNGRIFLIPVTLGSSEYRQVIPDHVLEITRSLRYFIAEEIRSSRRYLRMIDRTFPIDESHFFILNEHTGDDEIAGFLKPASEGNDMGLMSEAGLPGIADPGSKFIMAAHEKNIKVIPLSGPSSVLLGLTASGLNGQNFEFHGYLPVKQPEKNKRIRDLETAAAEGRTQIFIETPYRAQKMLESILEVCQGDTLLCMAADITLPSEDIRTMRISHWRKNKPVLSNRLVVFLIGR